MLPLLVGYIAQQMETTPTRALVARFWWDQRDAACIGRVMGDELRWFFEAMHRRYSNPVQAVATVELSLRREPNVHVLIRGVNLKMAFVRAYWLDRAARDVNFEVVRHPMSIAPYIFKIPLLGLVGPPAARDEILGFGRDLHGGCYGYQHGSFIDWDLGHGLEDRRDAVLDYAARHTEAWIAKKMPCDVTDALRRAVPPDEAVVDDLFRDISF